MRVLIILSFILTHGRLAPSQLGFFDQDRYPQPPGKPINPSESPGHGLGH